MSFSKDLGLIVSCRWAGLSCAAIFIGSALSGPTFGQTSKVTSFRPCLEVGKILEVIRSLHTGNSFDPVSSLILENRGAGGLSLTAFEENQFFVYAVGSAGSVKAKAGPGLDQDFQSLLTRRVIILRPSIVVVDDEIFPSDSASKVEWCLSSRTLPKIMVRKGEVFENTWDISWETLLPATTNIRNEVDGSRGRDPENVTLEATTVANPTHSRFIHVFNVHQKGEQNSTVHSIIRHQKDQVQLDVSTNDRIFQLSLPPPDHGAGTIAISSSMGKGILENRPLAAGVLPHGPEGTRLLDLWDSDYHGSQPAAWDIGRPSNELVKVVNQGTVKPCRVIDLCCGSGTDAVYLASKGFEVSGIDIAPTALSLAQRKASTAGVSVQWLFADVLAPPPLKPFDFIYDRGCYHVVRDQSLAAYLETLRRLSHPGTQFLLLAARASEHEANANSSGVSEEELRYDFLKLFDIEWLREIRLESNKKENGVDPPGWSALMNRNAEP